MTHPRNDPARHCPKIEAWPERDRALWLKALQPGSIVYGGGGVAAHLRTDSVEKIRKGYGRWLTFLTVQLWLDPAIEPALRINARTGHGLHRPASQSGLILDGARPDRRTPRGDADDGAGQ